MADAIMSLSPHGFSHLKPGGHVCLPYARDDEKLAGIVSFIRDGLVRGERCLYWGNRTGFSEVLDHLEALGIPVGDLCDRATLVLVDTGGGSRSQSTLDDHVASIREAVTAARSDGYTGLRVAGDSSTNSHSPQTHDQLASFESALTQLYADVRATGLCAFDQRTTNSSLIEVALATHQIAIISGRVCDNPFFKSPNSIPGDLSGNERVSWMTANILETAQSRELVEAENAALIMQSTFAAKRDLAYRRHIAHLTRALEARDRLLLTTARWLSRPLPIMCSHLDGFSKSEQLAPWKQALDTCSEHLSAISRLSQGLDEIAGFLQLQVVLRPESLDLIEVARTAIDDLRMDPTQPKVDVTIEGASSVIGTWDRLRLTRLFLSLVRTARDQGYDARVLVRIDDLGHFARLRFEFTLPHAPALSDSGERARTMAYSPSGESDYERLAVHTWSAREIVRLMGGTLGISTWADARVVFTLDLPKTAPEAPPSGDLPWS